MSQNPHLPIPNHGSLNDEFFRLLALPRHGPHAFTRAQLHIGLALQEGTVEQMRTAIDSAAQAGIPPQGWAWMALFVKRPKLMKVLQKEYGIDWGTLPIFQHGRGEYSHNPLSATTQKNDPKDWQSKEPLTHWVSLKDDVAAAELLLKAGVSSFKEVDAYPEKNLSYSNSPMGGIFRSEANKVHGEKRKLWLCEALEYSAFNVARRLWNASKEHIWSQDELDRMLLSVASPRFYRSEKTALSYNKLNSQQSLQWFKKLIEMGANPNRIWHLKKIKDENFKIEKKWLLAVEDNEWDSFQKSHSSLINEKGCLESKSLLTSPLHLVFSFFGNKALHFVSQKDIDKDVQDSFGRGLSSLLMQEQLSLPNLDLTKNFEKEKTWSLTSLAFIQNILEKEKHERYDSNNHLNEMLLKLKDSGVALNLSWRLTKETLKRNIPDSETPEEIQKQKRANPFGKSPNEIKDFWNKLCLSLVNPAYQDFFEKLSNESILLLQEKKELSTLLLKTGYSSGNLYQHEKYKSYTEKLKLMWEVLPDSPDDILKKDKEKKLRL